jgi:DNA topoisomerase VI subunit B
MAAVSALERTTFRTSRLLEFCTRKELVAQTGHEPDAWPLVVLKELLDNALDACEEAGVAPEIMVQVEPRAVTVVDNGPGMPPKTVSDILDFSSRVSSREAYVAPDRGAQGNALKTILAMPFVLDGAAGHVEICAKRLCHQIEFTVDALRQAPVIRHRHEQHDVTNGTSITVAWPESAVSRTRSAEVAELAGLKRVPGAAAAEALLKSAEVRRIDR